VHCEFPFGFIAPDSYTIYAHDNKKLFVTLSHLVGSEELGQCVEREERNLHLGILVVEYCYSRVVG